MWFVPNVRRHEPLPIVSRLFSKSKVDILIRFAMKHKDSFLVMVVFGAVVVVVVAVVVLTTIYAKRALQARLAEAEQDLEVEEEEQEEEEQEEEQGGGANGRNGPT